MMRRSLAVSPWKWNWTRTYGPDPKPSTLWPQDPGHATRDTGHGIEARLVFRLPSGHGSQEIRNSVETPVPCPESVPCPVSRPPCPGFCPPPLEQRQANKHGCGCQRGPAQIVVKVILRLKAIARPQPGIGGKSQPASHEQRQTEMERIHTQQTGREHKHLVGRRRRQDRRHQNGHEVVALKPTPGVGYGMRRRLAKEELPSAAGDSVKEIGARNRAQGTCQRIERPPGGPFAGHHD